MPASLNPARARSPARGRLLPQRRHREPERARPSVRARRRRSRRAPGLRGRGARHAGPGPVPGRWLPRGLGAHADGPPLSPSCRRLSGRGGVRTRRVRRRRGALRPAQGRTQPDRERDSQRRGAAGVDRPTVPRRRRGRTAASRAIAVGAASQNSVRSCCPPAGAPECRTHRRALPCPRFVAVREARAGCRGTRR